VNLTTPRRSVPALLAAVALLLTGCGGDDEGRGTPAREPDDAPSTTSPYGGHAHHGMGELSSVEDAAAIGPGPSVGDRWEIPVGISVCGQFIEAPEGGPVDGVSATKGGKAVVEPTDEAATGHAATLGSYAEAIGATLRTGVLRLPADVVPTEIEVGDEDIALGGHTFRTGDMCGTTPGAVQAWVYSADAVSSGKGILTVVTDPDRIPFAEDGMALVIAFAPDSSLPTLPPSAVIG